MKKYFLISLLFLLEACVTTNTVINYEKSYDFKSHRTFSCSTCEAQFNPKDTRYYNPEVRNYLSDLIRTKLEDYGYSYNDESPDLIYDFTILIEDLVDTVNQNTDFPNYKWREFEQDKFNYKQGSLIINLVEVKSGTLVWQGKAQKQLDRNPKNYEKKSEKIINTIFENFPYGPEPTN